MKKNTRNIAAVVAASLAFLGVGAATAKPLAKPYAGAVPRAEKRGLKTAPLRVQFDIDDVKDVAPGGELEFTAPGGKVHTIIFDRIVSAPLPGVRTWYGHVKGHDTKDVVITQGYGVVYGRISTPDAEYSFAPEQGYQFIVDTALERFQDHDAADDNDALSPPKGLAPAAAKASSGSAITANAAAAPVTTCVNYPCEVKIAFLSTPQREALQGGFGAVYTQVTSMIANTNQIFVRSQIPVRLVLAGTRTIAYREGNEPRQALNQITPTPGNSQFNAAVFGDVEGLRTVIGADLVMILTSGANLDPTTQGRLAGAGAAWVPNPGPLDSSSRSLMYSSIAGCWGYDCTEIFAHEIGHNMGNAHDRATATYDAAGTGQPIALGSFPYSYGHYRCVPNVLNCDVFANRDACVASTGFAECSTVDKVKNFVDIMGTFKTSARREMVFSNPSVQCGDNLAVGGPPSDSDPTFYSGACGIEGSTDAARTIRENGVALANMVLDYDIHPGPTATGTSLSVPDWVNRYSPLTMNAYVSQVGSSLMMTSGTVTFSDYGVAIEGCIDRPLDSTGTATCTVANLPGGVHGVVATFSGNAEYSPSKSEVWTVVVREYTTVLLTTPNGQLTYPYGTPVELVAVVVNGTSGTVAFMVNDSFVVGCETVPVVSEIARCTVGNLLRGVNSVGAVFSGTTFLATSIGTSGITTVVGTTTSVSSSLNPAPAGTSVTYTATVSSAFDPPPATSVSFYAGTTAMCLNAPLVGYTASCQYANLPVGSTPVVAQYNGGSFYNPSVAVLTQVITTASRPKTDFNNDGRADLLWQHTDGRTSAWLMNGASVSGAATLLGAGTGWSARFMRDFDGDGQADIVWQHTDGRTALWLMNGTSIKNATNLVGPATGWSVAHVGDFNGDGKADLLWMHTDGRPAIWLMNGITQVGGGPALFAAGLGWTPTHLADVNGDGKADIVWRHTDGRVAVWLMNGASLQSAANILDAGTAWSVKLVGDFNGDGKADLLWENTDGRPAIWLMNGTAPLQVGPTLFGPATGWTARFARDFDGDGRADILWEHTDGRASVWLMNGVAASSAATIRAAGTGYTAKVIGDFNADGRADIVWQHTDGRPQIWLMLGTAQVGGGPDLFGAGLGWTPVASLE